jgi:Flp pilus assembly pilin Flp
MKTLFFRFAANESGALSFEDSLTVFSLTIGFIAAFVLMNSTIVRLYEGIFRLLP